MLLTMRRGIHTWVLELPRKSGAVTAHSTICILLPKSSYQGQYLAPKKTPTESTPPPSFDRQTKYDKYPLMRYLIKSTAAHWKAYVEHEFVKQLGRAVLPRSAFIHYIMYGFFFLGGGCFTLADIVQRQDYHYLKYYARANG